MKILAGLTAALTTAIAPALTAAYAEDYNLHEVRLFLNELANGVKGYESQTEWHAEKDIACHELEAFTPADGKRFRLDPARAIASARAEGALGEAPIITANDAPCGAMLEFDNMAFDADLLTGAVKKRPLPDAPEAAWLESKTVRSMFPMWGYNQREKASPNSAWLQTLIGDNMGVRSAITNETIALTNDGSPDYQYFSGNDIWEKSGNIWSQDSTKFAGRAHDSRQSKGLTILDDLDGEQKIRRFNYWTRVGDALPVTTLYVFDVKKRTQVALSETGSANAYLFFLEWNPDGTKVAYLRVSRDLKSFELFEADAETGISEKLLTETAKKGIIRWPLPPKAFEYLPDGKRFIWRSGRDGFYGFYLYARDGAPPRKVSPNGYDVVLLDVDPRGDALIIAGPPDTAPAMLRQPLSGGDPVMLTDIPGIHDVEISPSGAYLLDTHQDINRAPATVVRDAMNGDIIAEVQRAVLTEARASWPAPERFVAKTADGKSSVHGVIYKPYNFDPEKTYPVIERIYGGMQLSVVPKGFPGIDGGDYELMLAYFASQGFVVVSMDAPGTGGRGVEYFMKRYGNWPDGIIPDHAAALREAARSRPWMDLERVGVDGNSFGGMLAIRAGLEEPGLYRAVAASVPQTDLYDIAWAEFQLGSPEANRAAYERGALAPRMKNLSTPLLVLAGDLDVNVSIYNTNTMLDALAEAGKPYELILFPGTNHTHEGRGDRYAYAIAAITRFFARELGCPQEIKKNSP